MKTKIFSILGIATVLVTLLSLLGFASPVAADTQAWSKIAAPVVSPYVVWVGPMAKAVDGTIYTAVGIAGDTSGTPSGINNGVWLYKSTDGGRTWKKTTQPVQSVNGSRNSPYGMPSGITVYDGAGSISNSAVYTDIQCPGPDGNMVYVTDGFDIFKSIDGGTTWVALTNLFEKLDDETAEEPVGYIVSISTGFIGGSVSPSAYTFAATSTFGGTVLGSYADTDSFNTNGGVYVLQESVFLNPWADTEVNQDRQNPWTGVDALKVQTFPDFATTQGVFAVVSDRSTNTGKELSGVGRTLVTTKYGAGQWDQTANDVILKWNAGGHPPMYDVNGVLLSADIYIPSDFSSNPTSANMVIFVGINAMDTQQSDVFYCQFGPAAPTPFTPTSSYDLNIDGDMGTAVSGMDGVGTIANASIMVSGYDSDDLSEPNVWVTRNGGISWVSTDDNINAKRPTGDGSMLMPRRALSSCLVMSDFATSGKGLVGTHGTDCGLSLTQDFGLTWNTIAFIATQITATDDLSLASDSTMYMSTDFLGGGSGGSTVSQSFTITAAVSTHHPQVNGTADEIGVRMRGSDGHTGLSSGNNGVFDDTLFVKLTMTSAGAQPTLAVTNGADTIGTWSGTGVGSTVTITLTYNNSEVDISAADDATTFTMDVWSGEVSGSDAPQAYGEILDRQDDAPLDTGLHAIMVAGPVVSATGIVDSNTYSTTSTYGVTLPDMAGFLVSAAYDSYSTTYIDLWVLTGSIDVSGADAGNGTYTPANTISADEIRLNNANPTATFVISAGFSTATGFVAQDTASGHATFGGLNPPVAGNVPYEILDDENPSGQPYTLTAIVTPPVPATELYSEWRYTPTSATTGWWERINSWSLYPTPYPDFDFIETTPAQDALFTVDDNASQLYRSVNKGQSWSIWGQPFPGTLQSWLVVSPTTVAIGSTGGIIYTTINGTIWFTRTAFTNTSVVVTDIRLAGNGDWLAAGIDSAGDINSAKSTNSGVAWTSVDLGTTGRFANATMAYIGAAADYATTGIVDVTSNGTGSPGAGVYWGTILPAPATNTYTQADPAGEWYSGNGATGLITSPGGPGFSAEGTGMAYTDAAMTIGLERVRGRVAAPPATGTAAAEFIPATSSGTPPAIHGLWVGANAVGGVALYTITNAGVVWTYTDTLNVAPTGVTAVALTSTLCTSSCPVGTTSASISWNAVANANLYFVNVDTIQQTNLYDAIDWAESHTGVAFLTTSTSLTSWAGVPNTTYYVSVWALRTTSTFIESLPGSFEGIENHVLSTFGAGGSFTTPLPSPTNLAPDSTTSNVPVKPTFSWNAVPGATGYQLQISTDPAFGTLVYDSGSTPGLTNSSYVYTGTALSNSNGYYWRVRALGLNNSAYVYAVFSTVPVVIPPVTVTNVPAPTLTVAIPTIILPTQPAVTVTVAAPVVTPILTVPQATIVIAQPTATTPVYIWIIVAVGAVLVLAVIILIIRTRRVV
jgi:hypothetical protein